MTLDSGQQKGSPSLTVALVGIVLAVVVMILSIAIVTGFKDEISGKIMHLDAHLRVSNAALGIDDNYSVINGREVREVVAGNQDFAQRIESISLIADKSAILKTDQDFMGIVFRGVDKGYDWRFLESKMIEGVVQIKSLSPRP